MIYSCKNIFLVALLAISSCLFANEKDFGIDRNAVLGRNLDYSPADKETVFRNPPPLVWLPVLEKNNFKQYIIKLSQDNNFKADSTMIFKTDLSVLCIDTVLKHGKYFWQYGVEDLKGKIYWSKIREFTISAKAINFPYCKQDDLKISPKHPRLLINQQILKDIRARAKSGDLKIQASNTMENVKKYINNDIIAEPDFMPPRTSPEFGVAYAKTLMATRPDMNKMTEAALAYALTSDAEAGNEAKRRVMHFFSWDPKGSTSHSHNDEPAMWMMMTGCRAYDWTYDLFTQTEREKIEKSIYLRAKDFYEHLRNRPFESNVFSSHDGRTIGLLGEAAIVLMDSYPQEALEYLDYATKIYWSVYPAWGKDDGGWNEGPGYWQAYMDISLHFVVALRNATKMDLSQRPFYQNTPFYRFYLTPPRSRMMLFGDGEQAFPPGKTNIIYNFACLLENPYLKWYVMNSKTKEFSSVLDYILDMNKIEAKAPAGLPLSKLFEGIGLVCSHTDLVDFNNNIGFYFISNPYGAVSHGHNGQNSFALEAYGEALAIASGAYNYYGSHHHEEWTQATKSKCAITVDGGKGQFRSWNAKGEIKEYLTNKEYDYFRGDASKAYGKLLDTAVRDVVHVRPGIYIVRDILSDNTKAHNYEYNLHALDRMQINPISKIVSITRPKAELEIRFMKPDSIVFEQIDKYTPPPVEPKDFKFKNTWHLKAISDKVNDVEFISILLPVKAESKSSLEEIKTELIEDDDFSIVKITQKSGIIDTIYFAKKRDEKFYTCNNLISNKEVFGVKINNKGEILSLLNCKAI